MNLNERIIDILKESGADNIDKMLQYMDKNKFHECHSSSHNHWKGGTAQHVWAVYLIAKSLRDEKLNNPIIAKYATDKKLAIVCLLHDICDMKTSVYNNKHEYVSDHGEKSYWMMKNLNVGTEIERLVVRNHMYRNATIHSQTQEETDEYIALHSLITEADHQASGTAWNSTRFKERRTQHIGKATDDLSYLRAVAMDRTVQSGIYHLYIDKTYELRKYRNYNRKDIKWNAYEDIICNLNKIDKLEFGNSLDIITAAHQYSLNTGERVCLVVGVNSEIPGDKDTRLRRGWIEEQDLLICSNLLNSFYESKKCEEKGKRRFRFEFSMRSEIKKNYQKLADKKGGIYLEGVRMIRDGSCQGFPFVEPWTVDLLLVPGKKNILFATRSENIR